MSERPQLALLAERCGVQASYVAYDGRDTPTPDKTRETLLLSLGLDASSEEQAERGLRALDAEARRPGLAPVRVARAGSPELSKLELRLPEGASGMLRYRLELRLEHGETHALEAEVAIERETAVVAMPTPSELSFGYHTLSCSMSLDGRVLESTQDLIVVPESGLQISEQIGARRAAGLWGHIYSIHSKHSWGIGDLSDLSMLAGWAASFGVELIGINPLHAVDNSATEVSPYYPLSRLYRNPIYLDVKAVVARSRSPEARAMLASIDVQLRSNALQSLARIDYAAVYAHKRRVLDAAYRGFAADKNAGATQLSHAYAAYRAREGRALTDFASFCALREHLLERDPKHADWRNWPAQFRNARSPAVTAFADEHADAVELHAYLQFELDQQLASAQRAATGCGMPIGLYGDLAVGDAPHSADIWAQPQLYARGVHIGAPPDPYSDRGQDWGLAPINPLELQRARYQPFRALLRTAFRHMGALRIDHVMGLGRQFFVPAGSDARDGGYVRFPLADLVGIVALESRRARALVIGEDLGVVPDGFREQMAAHGLLRSQVLYFEHASPRDYARGALATLSTHDLPPLLGFWTGHDLALRRRAGNIASDDAFARARDERARFKAHLLGLLRAEDLLPNAATEPPVEEICEALQLLLAGAASCVVAFAIDDLTLEREPLNVPAATLPSAPNWSRRSSSSLEQIAASERIGDLLYKITQRVTAR